MFAFSLIARVCRFPIRNPKDGLVRQAVSNSKRDDVKVLLEEGGDVDEQDSKTLYTPLMLAVRDGSKEIVQLLLDYDADITRRDKDGILAVFSVEWGVLMTPCFCRKNCRYGGLCQRS